MFVCMYVHKNGDNFTHKKDLVALLFSDTFMITMLMLPSNFKKNLNSLDIHFKLTNIQKFETDDVFRRTSPSPVILISSFIGANFEVVGKCTGEIGANEMHDSYILPRRVSICRAAPR